MMNNSFEYQQPKNTPVTDQELIADLKLVAEKYHIQKMSQSAYSKYGKYNNSTFRAHFGTWNEALQIAGLGLSNEIEISDERLFENLLSLWQTLGKQPARADLSRSYSLYSQSPYLRSFGNWTNAIKAFIAYINVSEKIMENNSPKIENSDHKTGRDPSLRLRYRILKRDNFRCSVCGASPAKDSSIELHLDHITPWNRGGETVESNLRTLCRSCNIGKSDVL